MSTILGLSFGYHDSAAAIVIDGEVAAAAQEERFSRKKNDASFPAAAVNYCLRATGVTGTSLDSAIFYEDPYAKLDRIFASLGDFPERSRKDTLTSLIRERKFDVPSLIAEKLGI